MGCPSRECLLSCWDSTLVWPPWMTNASCSSQGNECYTGSGQVLAFSLDHGTLKLYPIIHHLHDTPYCHLTLSRSEYIMSHWIKTTTMSLFLYASETYTQATSPTAPSAVEAGQLQAISQVRFLLKEMLDPFQENSQRIPTGREENIKCNEVLNATSLTCVLYLRTPSCLRLGISLTLLGKTRKSQNLCRGLVKGL